MTKPKADQTCGRCGLRPKRPGAGKLCETCFGTCEACDAPAERMYSGYYRRWCARCRPLHERKRANCGRCGGQLDGASGRYCLACERIRNQQRSGYTERERRRIEAARRRNYGLLPEAYEALLASQDGKCGGCGKPDELLVAGPRGPRHSLQVDHDHESGVVRGVLCSRCNNLLKAADDDPAVLRTLAAYLDAAAVS